MNCFDCSSHGRLTPAVGACTVCGAGLCVEHVHIGTHEQAHASGPGAYTPKVTRTFTCTMCAAVVDHGDPLLAQRARR